MDTTFDSSSGSNSDVWALAAQGDGKIIILGRFNTYSGVNRRYIARINSDGSLDTTFNVGEGFDDYYQYAVAIQRDGKILIGGDFRKYDTTNYFGIVRLFGSSTLVNEYSNNFYVGFGDSNMIFDKTGLSVLGSKVGIGTLATSHDSKFTIVSEGGSQTTSAFSIYNQAYRNIFNVFNSGKVVVDGPLSSKMFTSKEELTISSGGATPIIMSTAGYERLRITEGGETEWRNANGEVIGAVQPHGSAYFGPGPYSLYYGKDAGLGSYSYSSIGIGSEALQGTANYSVAVGMGALKSGGGEFHVAIGFSALSNLSESVYSSNNIAIGMYSMKDTQGGTSLIGLGSWSLSSNTTGTHNMALGHYALSSNTTGSYNVAVGDEALNRNTTGDSNVASGYAALYSNTTGNYNVASGSEALYNNTTGNYNVASGYGALYNNRAKQGSTAVGYNAMYYAHSISTGATLTYNTALGYQALRGSTNAGNNSGTYNTVLGANAGLAMSTGSNNTLVGYNAGSNLTSGGYNIIIGSGITATAATTSNQLNIGNAIYGTLTNGYIGLGGLTTPGYRLDLPNTATVAGRGRANQWSTYSDISLKENILTIQNPLDKILALNPVSFTWKGTSVQETGLIAQWTESIIPEIVSTADDGIKSIDYSKLTPYLAGAVQQLNTKIVALEDSKVDSSQDVSLISEPGWYRVAKTDSYEGTNVKISNISVGSSQNLNMYVDRGNVTVISNFVSSDRNFTKVRVNSVGTTVYLETYIEEVNNQSVKVKVDSDRWSVVKPSKVEDIYTGKIYSLNGIQFGVGDMFGVASSTGSILAGGVYSDVGDSSNRWNDIYAKGAIRLGSGGGQEGVIRFNTEKKVLEMSNDGGSTWLPVGDQLSKLVLCPEYAGAVLYAEGDNSYGRMTSDAQRVGDTYTNYYQWVSDRETLQSYDILVRVTLPSDFRSWRENAVSLEFVTENSASIENNSVSLSLVSKEGVDVEVSDGVSKLPGVWERIVIKGSDINHCSSAGDTCTLRISLSSALEYYTRVGDIVLNYNRSL